MREYRALLARADGHDRACRAAFPRDLPCGRGCRDCCLGLFDVSLLDRDLLREGLEALGAGDRRDIGARAAAILQNLRTRFPGLGEDLDGWRDEEIDALCDAEGPVECPVLGKEGECRLYDHRPLLCRLQGAPLVDLAGVTVHPGGCPRCTLGPDRVPRFDIEALRREERRLLRRRYRGRSGVTVLIPQAVSAP
jgi:Fe-S-cluster containining protein